MNRRGGVAAGQVYMVALAGQAYAFVYFVEGFDRETVRYRNTHEQLPGCSVHGYDIGKIYSCAFIPQVFQWHVSQVKVNPFHKQVGRNQGCFVSIIKYGGIVANAFYG